MLTGCASDPAELPKPPIATAEDVAAATQSAAEETAAADQSDAANQEEEDRITVVLEEGGDERRDGRTLMDAAIEERRRRETAAPAQIVITDKNLHEFATGELTVVETDGSVETDTKSAATVESSSAPTEDDDPEAYWRGRIRRARQNWASTVEEIAHLEERIGTLRQQFYAADDPYDRDTRIKPSWDLALERLDDARAASERFRAEVDRVLEEGRRQGALPGWLREGVDLEPERTDEENRNRLDPAFNEHQPIEPEVVSEGSRRP